jgi:hypothetical protein
MSANGHRNPPRPRIEVVKGAASEEESAAIAAALEQFLTETAPAREEQAVSRWQQAALREGVMREPSTGSWGLPGG